jgi:hypothetical protein
MDSGRDHFRFVVTKSDDKRITKYRGLRAHLILQEETFSDTCGEYSYVLIFRNSDSLWG